MRVIAEKVLLFGTNDARQVTKTVRDYRDEYRIFSDILDRNPGILDFVHQDIEKLSQANSSRGRKADFTSENLFRAILVMQIEGLGYREASVRIAESETLQNFCRLLKKCTIDFTLLNKAYSAIQPETWQTINQVLGLRAVLDEQISVDHIRTDTTVTECNIHWPTDASLLWDVYRVIAREISKAKEYGWLGYTWRFHTSKIKKLFLNVTRYSRSKSKKRLPRRSSTHARFWRHDDGHLANVASGDRGDDLMIDLSGLDDIRTDQNIKPACCSLCLNTFLGMAGG